MKKFLLLIGSIMWAGTLFAQPTPVAGVKRIIAGTNVTVSPSNGTGTVTVNSTGGGTPGGAIGDLQYNNAGTFGGITPGTGVLTALGVNVGSAGAPVLLNGAGGTPSSIVLTNATGTASNLISGSASTVTPAGSTLQLQYNNAGTSAGTGNIIYGNGLLDTAGMLTFASQTTQSNNVIQKPFFVAGITGISGNFTGLGGKPWAQQYGGGKFTATSGTLSGQTEVDATMLSGYNVTTSGAANTDVSWGEGFESRFLNASSGISSEWYLAWQSQLNGSNYVNVRPIQVNVNNTDSGDATRQPGSVDYTFNGDFFKVLSSSTITPTSGGGTFAQDRNFIWNGRTNAFSTTGTGAFVGNLSTSGTATSTGSTNASVFITPAAGTNQFDTGDGFPALLKTFAAGAQGVELYRGSTLEFMRLASYDGAAGSFGTSQNNAFGLDVISSSGATNRPFVFRQSINSGTAYTSVGAIMGNSGRWIIGGGTSLDDTAVALNVQGHNLATGAVIGFTTQGTESLTAQSGGVGVAFYTNWGNSGNTPVQITNLSGNNPGLWFSSSPSSSNYALQGGSSFTNLNAPSAGTINFRIGNGTQLAITSSAATFGLPVVNSDATDATSSVTGSVKTAGGLGIAKAVWIGGLLNVAGAATVTGHTTFEGVTSTGATGTGKFVYDGTPTVNTPVITGGLTASGSGANTFAGSTGTFLTSTGAVTLGGGTNAIAVNGPTTITPTARSSGVASYFTVTTPADTAQTASTESIGSSFTAATRQWATGALTTQRERVFAAPTYGFVGASTLTTAINVDIADPIAGTNGTLTNKYGLRVNNQQVTGTLTANTGTNLIGALVDSVDGSTPLNNINQVVATGTVYTMTTSSAAVAFGTTSPILTIANAGTYAVYVTTQLSFVGTTFATPQSATFKLRRTNNTAADLTGSSFSAFLPALTTTTDTGPSVTIGPIKYTTTNTNDTVTVFGILSGSTGAGSVTASDCTITAIRAY